MASVQAHKTSTPAGRRDPAPKRVDRTLAAGAIKNADPTKKYVWVYKASPDGSGIGYYENLGFEIETYRVDGVKSATQRKDIPLGTPIEFMGNVLMSAPKDEQEELDRDGEQEMRGWLNRMVDHSKSGVDNLRGINVRGRDNSPILSLENKTGVTQVEVE